MLLEISLKIVGILMLILVGLNFALPSQLAWREEFGPVSLLNRQIFYVHGFFIVLTCSMMGMIALFFTHALLERTTLAKLILAWLSVFWLARVAIQLFYYSPTLWRKNRFRTLLHCIFSIVFAGFAATFIAAFWRQFHAY